VLFMGLPHLLGTKRYWQLLACACVLFAVSWYLPSPDIYGQQTSFVTHFLGGGVFCGLLGVYLKRAIGWHAKWFAELAALFALVSSLGVINELFEVMLWMVGAMPEGITDTSWDLVANTAGALCCYAVYKGWQCLHSASTK
jgi:hypothetical protein